MKIIEKYSKETGKHALSIAEAHYVGDFAVRLAFSDSHKILVDFKPFLEHARHPSIIKYRNERLFKRFQIKEGNLDWNDFDMCFPVDDLYENNILHRIKRPRKDGSSRTRFKTASNGRK